MLKKPHKLRVLVLGGMFCLLGGMVGARLVWLQVTEHDRYRARATGQQVQTVVLQAERGDILDRRGRPLATSTGTLSVYIDPKYITGPEAPEGLDVEALARGVAQSAGLSAESVLRRFQSTRITAIARQMEPEVAHRIVEQIAEQDVSGLGYWFHRESKRLYPRSLAPHVIGFCGTDPDGDNQGLDGLEKLYDTTLQGTRISGKASRTGIRQVVQPFSEADIQASKGATLVLTVDAAIQEAAEEAVERAVLKHNGVSGGAIVQDTETGAILALASYPSFDNSSYTTAPRETLRNRLLTDPLETGSVAKLFTAALLLDRNYITPDTLVDCGGGEAYFGRRRVEDTGNYNLKIVPFFMAIRTSSNVGIIRAAEALNNDEWYAHLRALGLGSPTGVDLPGEGGGILRSPDSWTSLTRSSLPMGYEMALTPLQIANAVTALINGGELLKPHIVREVRDARGKTTWRAEREVVGRVISPMTSAQMRWLMEDVVANGSAKAARMEGFRVGGKTGTTRKSHVMTHREYIASFAGAFPMERPKVTIYCYVDSPQPEYYASQVAAPLFHELAKASALHLGLVPTLEADVAAAPPLAWEGDAASEALALREFAGPVVPNLVGMTLAEVREALAGWSGPLRIVGSGRVTAQDPAAFASAVEGRELTILLSSEAPRVRGHEIAASAAQGDSR
jgi:cell division protein FtsI/penicillin-binding protein 2